MEFPRNIWKKGPEICEKGAENYLSEKNKLRLSNNMYKNQYFNLTSLYVDILSPYQIKEKIVASQALS